MNFEKTVGLNRFYFKFFRLCLCPIMYHKVFFLVVWLQISPFGARQLQSAEAVGWPMGARNSDPRALSHISVIAQIPGLIQVLKKNNPSTQVVGCFGG